MLNERQYIHIPAPVAESRSRHTAINHAGIAAISAISLTASEGRVVLVNKEYRIKLESYLASMAQAKSMLIRGILTTDDYAKIDTIMAEKYGISSCSIYRGMDLIYTGFRGNMSHYEEVTQCPKL